MTNLVKSSTDIGQENKTKNKETYRTKKQKSTKIIKKEFIQGVNSAPSLAALLISYISRKLDFIYKS